VDLRPSVIHPAQRATDHGVEGRHALEAQAVGLDAAEEILPGHRAVHHQGAHGFLPLFLLSPDSGTPTASPSVRSTTEATVSHPLVRRTPPWLLSAEACPCGSRAGTQAFSASQTETACAKVGRCRRSTGQSGIRPL